MPNNRNENVELRLDTNTLRPLSGAGRKLFVETYGCQMNVGDTEIVVSVMQREGYVYTERIDEADVILINTCSIRDNAEQRIWGRLAEMKRYRRANPGLVVGVIGCMAERLKEKLVEGPHGVDVVAGPDVYRDLPRLVREAEAGGKGVNVLLSTEETYAEIAPVRLDRNGVSAFVAIMRGCNNFCSYCVVPYTRGRERSRDPETILAEVRTLFGNGYREVTLLGQNVNSYRFGEVDFPGLMRRVASVSPLLRVRFATSHPKDISDSLLEVMAEMPNICRAIHLPAQSGASSMLARMNRKYTREWYLDRVAAIRRYDRPDRRIFGRDGGGARRDALADARGRLRVRLYVQIFGAPRHLRAQAPARRRARRGEVGAAGRNHRPAERTEPREQPARRGARIRSAGRGNVQARREPAFGPYLAEQGRGLRPRPARRRRLCACAYYGVHPGDAVRRRNHLRI